MKIVFGAIITEGHGKVGGQIIQQSYGGYQLRNIVQPVNPQTPPTQYNRVYFRRLSSEWRDLSSEQRDGWISNAPDGVSGFEFFMSTNLPQFRISGTIIQEYITPVSPISGTIDYVSFTAVGINDFVLAYTSMDVSDQPSGWNPLLRCSGWIRESQYSFPPRNRVMNFVGLFWFFGNIQFSITDLGNGNNIPQFNNDKCMMEFCLVNSITGQIQVMNTTEINAGTLS